MKNKKPEMVVCPLEKKEEMQVLADFGYSKALTEILQYCIEKRREMTSEIGHLVLTKPHDNQGLMNFGCKKKAYQEVIDKINGKLKSVSPPEPVKSEEGLLLNEDSLEIIPILKTYENSGFTDGFTNLVNGLLQAQLIECQTAFAVERAAMQKASQDHQKQVEELKRVNGILEQQLTLENKPIAQAKAEAYKEIGELLWNWRVTKGQGWVELLNIITQLKSGLPQEGGK